MCLNWCNKINEKEKGLTIWLAKVKNDYDIAGGEDAECNQVTVKEVPDKVENVGVVEEVKEKPKDKGKGKGKEKEVAHVAEVPVQKPTQTPREKIRHDWYQSSNTVTIDLLASGVPKDEVEVKFEERSVSCIGYSPYLSAPYTYINSNRSSLAFQFLTRQALSTLRSPRSTTPSTHQNLPTELHPKRSKLHLAKR